MRVYKEMTIVGMALWAFGAVRLYKNGNCFSYVFRPWHPLTWFMAVLLVVPCALLGEKLSCAVPVRLNNFWIQNKDQLQWVSPFTLKDSLKPFIFRVQSAQSGEEDFPD